MVVPGLDTSDGGAVRVNPRGAFFEGTRDCSELANFPWSDAQALQGLAGKGCGRLHPIDLISRRQHRMNFVGGLERRFRQRHPPAIGSIAVNVRGAPDTNEKARLSYRHCRAPSANVRAS